MSVLQKLVADHKALGIYSITEDSNINCELKAYAEGLEMLRETLQEMEKEAFFFTANTYGLSAAERLWGAQRGDLTTQKRREMLLTRSAFGYDDFTPEGAEKVLKFLGVEGVIREYPRVFRITVDVSSQKLTEGQRNWIVSQLYGVFPAHLEVDAVFDGFEWDALNERNISFDDMENKNMLWSEIDVYVE